jgi:hypothetical protein
MDFIHGVPSCTIASEWYLTALDWPQKASSVTGLL